MILSGDLNLSMRLDDVSPGRWQMPIAEILAAAEDAAKNGHEEWYPMAVEVCMVSRVARYKIVIQL